MALLTDVTHELRTPLATIGGYMEGLLDGVIKPDEQTFTLVLQESRRLQRLTEDLQLLSRAEAGQIPIMPRTLNLRDMMIQLYERLKPEFDAAQIDLVLITPETLPQLQADPDRVHQILINLLNNARRYTPQGGCVTLRAHPQQETVLISVEDTGIGIAAEHLPHIFERFYRVDKSRARASGGSGIGLTIARHLVYAHGGEIWVTSDGPDLGSQFHVALPSAVDVRPAPRPQATIAAEA
jgi:histidine kinase